MISLWFIFLRWSGISAHSDLNPAVEGMKRFGNLPCFMYPKQILRPGIRLSENFPALYWTSMNFHSGLPKKLNNFLKLFFSSSKKSSMIDEWKAQWFTIISYLCTSYLKTQDFFVINSCSYCLTSQNIIWEAFIDYF